MYFEIKKTIEGLNFDTIANERKLLLQNLTTYIQEHLQKDGKVQLNFICTHNSRRSHLSQVWSQTMAHFYNIPNVFCYSGGTEATAMFPKIAETLTFHGFQITALSKNENPVYAIQFADDAFPVIAFSKRYNFNSNPKSNFAAVMTCTHADQNCPFIPEATRISLPFDDPKAFDNTPLQTQKYRERSLQIATELAYVFSNIKTHDSH